VLDGVMESIGLGGEENAGRRLTVLRAIDKLDKFSIDEVAKLLGPGRWDGGEEGKGDFTKGAGLDDPGISRVINFTGWGDPISGSKSEILSNAATIANFEAVVGDNVLGREGTAELIQIKELVEAGGYNNDRIIIDPSVVRGLEYYTGPVYEVELLLDTKDEKGRPVRFGSVGGGGRYDGLVSRFRGEVVPATGFSIGVSRLQAALTMLGKLDTKPDFGPVVVTVFDRDRVADYQKMVAVLRQANIRAELYLGNPKNMGNQLKYADRRNSPCVIIQGSDEKARGEVQIKDLIEGAKAAAAIASNQEWRETRPAQVSCREDELVAKVREVLARHEVKWAN
jgi:histidyl-tRNA synthetase